MKTKVIYLIFGFVLFGCVSHEKPVPVPQPQLTENISKDSRTIASQQEYLQTSYNNYFGAQKFYQRILKLENVATQLHGLMPEKGHAKKGLLAKHLADIRREKNYLNSIPSVSTDNSVGWLPSSRSEKYNEKIQSLGRLVASYKVMNQMGLYLNGMDLFEADTRSEDFYLSMLNKAIGDIEGRLNGIVLVYKPENKEANENRARLEYSHHLANGVRFSLPRAFQYNSDSQYRRLDQFFKRLAQAENLPRIQTLLRSADGQQAKQALKNLHVMNSGDIQGFNDEVDLTLSTKFGLEMIQQLATSAR